MVIDRWLIFQFYLAVWCPQIERHLEVSFELIDPQEINAFLASFSLIIKWFLCHHFNWTCVGSYNSLWILFWEIFLDYIRLFFELFSISFKDIFTIAKALNIVNFLAFDNLYNREPFKPIKFYIEIPFRNKFIPYFLPCL